MSSVESRSDTNGVGATALRGIDAALVDLAIDEHRRALPALDRLWDYYRNPTRPGVVPGKIGAVRGLAQASGLPARLVSTERARDERSGREVVIENDIAWRVHTMVDFLFGKPVAIVAGRAEGDKREQIERAIETVWARSGGLGLLQDAALLGHVFGHVDFLVRVDEPRLRSARTLDEACGAISIELIEPRRGIPLLDERDYRELAGYVVHFERELNEVEPEPAWIPWRRESRGSRRRGTVTEVFAPGSWTRLEDGEPVARGHQALVGGVPIVHVQNISQPLRYAGLGEVEPLIPLQDELNTRLSDRACRVTLQSFQMYLARGMDGLDGAHIGPGRVFSTDNPDARIEAFGGDAASPSEAAHVTEIRSAIDKISGVPPIASGSVEARVGNLTSANALRITMVGLLSKTARKRETYGRGILQIGEMVLGVLDRAGVLGTSPAERDLGLEWPDPLPIDERELVASAPRKRELGVPTERLLEELGYVPRAGAAGKESDDV